jgi:hypothetical protein
MTVSCSPHPLHASRFQLLVHIDLAEQLRLLAARNPGGFFLLSPV